MNGFGSAVTAGDFDADGFDDLVIGIHNQSTDGITWSGAVVVIFGEAPSLSPCCARVLNLNQNSPGSVDEAEVGDRFGHTLATGDFNNDGYDDLAVGVTAEDVYGVVEAGAVHVFYGPELLLDNELWSLATLGQTMSEKDWFGRRLETGDFNGDGYGDLAVGAPRKDIGVLEDPGAVAVVYGSEAGLRPQGAQFWTIDDVGSEGLVEYAKLGLSLAARGTASTTWQCRVMRMLSTFQETATSMFFMVSRLDSPRAASKHGMWTMSECRSPRFFPQISLELALQPETLTGTDSTIWE